MYVELDVKRQARMSSLDNNVLYKCTSNAGRRVSDWMLCDRGCVLLFPHIVPSTYFICCNNVTEQTIYIMYYYYSTNVGLKNCCAVW